MNLGAAADSFHDLLPQVAALFEVHRLQLAGFLHQVAFGKLFAVSRVAVLNSYRSCVRRGGLTQAG